MSGRGSLRVGICSAVHKHGSQESSSSQHQNPDLLPPSLSGPHILTRECQLAKRKVSLFGTFYICMTLRQLFNLIGISSSMYYLILIKPHVELITPVSRRKNRDSKKLTVCPSYPNCQTPNPLSFHTPTHRTTS